MNTYFAVTAPGLEPFTRQEAVELDLVPASAISTDSNTEPESGGVTFKGELEVALPRQPAPAHCQPRAGTFRKFLLR